MSLSAKLRPVESRCIVAVGWLEDGRIAIKFPSGRVRFYRAAESKGRFYNAKLKMKFSPSGNEEPGCVGLLAGSPASSPALRLIAGDQVKGNTNGNTK